LRFRLAPAGDNVVTGPTVSARALFSYGFRPFFLLAAGWAAGTSLVLFSGLNVGTWPGDALPLARWHGHEMLFGFVAAAIGGFLLTAVPTWTESKPVSGWPLAALTAVWLAGRVAMSPWLGLQGTPWMLLDALFFPGLAVGLGVSLVRSRNYRNFQFFVFLALLTAADLLFLGTHLGWLAPLPFDPLRFAANLVLLMIAVVGGRIIPLFTRNALLKIGTQRAIAPLPWLDRAALAAVAAVVVVDVVRQDTPLAGWLAAITGLLLAARLSRWQGHRTLRMPIVWILHAGYTWVVIALLLKSVWLLTYVPWAANWLHALTAGAFGTMILAVMTRVALGHTGRELVVAKSITAAYALVIVGAALRVAGPVALPAYYLQLLSVAIASWAAAFVLFLVVYAPALMAPRPDSTPLTK
jgi:uncharacterized protein involved in response to NO